MVEDRTLIVWMSLRRKSALLHFEVLEAGTRLKAKIIYHKFNDTDVIEIPF